MTLFSRLLCTREYSENKFHAKITTYTVYNVHTIVVNHLAVCISILNIKIFQYRPISGGGGGGGGMILSTK